MDSKIETAQTKPLTEMLSEDAAYVERQANRALVGRICRKVNSPSIIKAGVVIADQGVYSVTNFIVGVVVARVCSKEQYGLYVLGIGVLMAFMGFQAAFTGIPFTVLRLDVEKQVRSAYVGSIICLHLLLSGLAVCLLVLAVGWSSAIDSRNDLTIWLFALMPLVAVVSFREFLRYVFLSQLREVTCLLMGLIANISTLTILAWAYYHSWITVPVTFAFVAGSSALAVSVFVIRERRQIVFTKSLFLGHCWKNVQFGKWLAAKHVAFLIYAQIYPWILAIFSGAGKTAIYGAAMLPIMVLNPLLTGLQRFMIPRMARAAIKGGRHLRKMIFGTMLIVALPLLALVSAAGIFSEDTLRVMFQAKYSGYGFVVFIFALQFAVGAIGSPIASGITAIRKTDVVFKATILGTMVSLFIGIPLTIYMGPIGAGWGLLLSKATVRLYQLRMFLILTKEPTRTDPIACVN